MRILYVTHRFLPDFSRGAELCAYYALKSLARQHEVCLFYRYRDKDTKAYTVRHGHYEDIPYTAVNNPETSLQHYHESYDNPAMTARFAECLERFRPDIVHIHHLTGVSAGIIKAAKENRVPLILTLHDFWLLCARGQMLRRDLSACSQPKPLHCAACQVFPLSKKTGAKERSFLLALRRNLLPARKIPGLTSLWQKAYLLYAWRLQKKRPEWTEQMRQRSEFFKEAAQHIDLFISPSHALLERFCRIWPFMASKTIYLKNGYPRSLLPSSLKKTESSRVRFAFIGTLMPSKGIFLLLQAFKKYAPRRASLSVYGSFAAEDELFGFKKLVSAHFKEKGVHYQGEFQHNYLAEIFKNIDVLVVPSLWQENAPLTIQEAFLTGTPVITADQGGMAEMVRHNYNGLLFKPGNSRDLRKQMKRITAEKGLLEKLKEHVRGKRTQEEITDINSYIQKITAIYQKTLVTHHRSKLDSEAFV